MCIYVYRITDYILLLVKHTYKEYLFYSIEREHILEGSKT